MTTDSDAPMKILIPLDGSDAAAQILDSVIPLARKLDAEIVLLKAVAGVADTLAHGHVALDIAEEAVADDKHGVEEYLEGVALRIRGEGLTVSTIVAEGSPGKAIQHHIDGVTMIAMTTHGRGGIVRTLFGSVTDEVLRNCHIPVLVLHPK